MRPNEVRTLTFRAVAEPQRRALPRNFGQSCQWIEQEIAGAEARDAVTAHAPVKIPIIGTLSFVHRLPRQRDPWEDESLASDWT